MAWHDGTVDLFTRVLFNLSTAGIGSVNELLDMEWMEVFEYQYLLDVRNVM